MAGQRRAEILTDRHKASAHYAALVQSSGRTDRGHRRMQLYLKNIAPRWKKEFTKAAERKLIFTPYLTSRIAESVVGTGDNGASEIHTVFAAELFASGASSIKTLRTLHERGHKLFHLPDLHAKLFLIPGTFASVGSQNLTAGGTRNREASIATRQPKLLEAIEAELAPWLAARVEITADMLDDMDSILGTVEPFYKRALQACEAAEKELKERTTARRDLAARLRLHQCVAAQLRALYASRVADAARQQAAQREAEARRQAEAAARQREVDERERQAQREAQLHHVREVERQRQRVAKLHANITRAQQSIDYADMTITMIRNSAKWNEQITMLASSDRDLGQWRVGGRSICLEHGKRYMILQESGKLGWGRVMKTRVSFIGDCVQIGNGLRVNQHPFNVVMRADWTQQPPHGRNLVFEVQDVSEVAVCEVSCWFDLKEALK